MHTQSAQDILFFQEERLTRKRVRTHGHCPHTQSAQDISSRDPCYASRVACSLQVCTKSGMLGSVHHIGSLSTNRLPASPLTSSCLMMTAWKAGVNCREAAGALCGGGASCMPRGGSGVRVGEVGNREGRSMITRHAMQERYGFDGEHWDNDHSLSYNFGFVYINDRVVLHGPLWNQCTIATCAH